MAQPRIQCPAGQERHPVLSPHAMDVECRIQGNLRPAAYGGKPAICCDNYADCMVWKQTQVLERGQSTLRQRDQTVSTRRAPDVLAA